MAALPSGDDAPGRPAGTSGLILRDVLAIDRTVLANERTLLAYIRTVLGLLVAGGSLIHFVETWWAVLGGGALLTLAPVFLGFGLWRYRSVSRDLRRTRATGA